MTFEAGPWHCFGNELLDRLLQLIQQNNQNNPLISTATGKPSNARSSQGALSLLTSNFLKKKFIFFYNVKE